MTFTPLAKRIILISAILGTLLSGYLSYQNYFMGGCKKQFISCGVGNTKVLIAGQPTCVYGFAMFFLTLVFVLVAWKKQPATGWLKTMLILGIAGVLFSGSVGYYEIVTLKALEQGSLPACVYGFVFYGAILIASIQSMRTKTAIMPSATPPPAAPPTSMSM